MLVFSLFTACAEDNNDKVIEKPTEHIEINKKYTDGIELFIKKDSSVRYFYISESDTVDFNSHNKDYTFTESTDTIIFRNKVSQYLGKLPESKKLQLIINNLKPNNSYFITVTDSNEKIINSVKISTLFYIPTVQAYQIVMTENSESSATFQWSKGNGRNRIIVVRRGKEPENPVDGVKYKVAEKYGDNNGMYGNGNYVVYDSQYDKDKKNNFTLENLEFDRYFVKIFEYNGDGENRNYLDSNSRMNPAVIQPSLPAPKNLTAQFSKGNTFIIQWNKINDTVEYEIQVALDKNFQNIISNYDGLRTGTSNVWEIPVNVMDNDQCFYRVRAIYGSSRSNYSQPKRVTTK